LEQEQEDIMELNIPTTFHNSSQENEFQKPLGYSDDNLSNMLNNSNSLDKIFVNPLPHHIDIPHQEFEPKALRFSNNSLLQIKINADEILEPVPNQKTPVRQVKTYRVHNTEEFERIADEHEKNPDYRVEVKQCSFIEHEYKPSMKVLDNEEEDDLLVSTSRRFERNIEDRSSNKTNYDAWFSNRRFSENNAIAVTRSFNENSLMEKERFFPVSKQLPKIHEEDKFIIKETRGLIQNQSFLNRDDRDKMSFYGEIKNPNKYSENPISSKSTPRISREEILELKKKYGRKK